MPDILFPPGRMIGGNLDKLFPRTESNGTPKVGKDGQPEMQCSVGYAIPKGTEQHWSQTSWGAEIYKTGVAAHPQFVQSPAFSWKITDGDSQIPNKRGKRPCDQTGYSGHWVLWFSQGWLPKCVNADGSVELFAGAIVPGYYIQMYGNVAGNRLVPNGTPGVYLNPIAVALVGEGDKIITDVNTSTVGFGGGALPPGARPVTPAASQFIPPAGGGYQPPIVPPAPEYIQPPPAAGGYQPPAAPVPPVRQMTPKAAGQTYEAFRQAGWTDEQLIANGYMTA